MERISPYSEEKWLLSNPTKDEQQEDDMLSLSDLPLHHLSEKQEKVDQTTEEDEEESDFNFFRSKSEMCCADEVFSHGQMLPLRHSVSSEKGLMSQYVETKPLSISRSESMDHRFYSSGLVSSRSSSISQSSSSGSSTKTPQSHFFAHPSPSPRLHNYSRSFPSNCRNSYNKANKSSVWRIFRMGLIATPQPEIAIHDLKTRTNLGSRKSNTSSSTTSSKSSNKQKKGYNFLGGGGCKCAVDDIVPLSSRVVLQKQQQQEEGKSKLSHRRTFEWLKQLSLEVEATR